VSEIFIGQEAVVPKYGLGRIISISKEFIKVKPYVAGYTMTFDPSNIRPVKLVFVA